MKSWWTYMEKSNISFNTPKKVIIIGVPISVVNMDSVLSFVCDELDHLRGNYICASNVHTTVMAHENQSYLKAQMESVISLPDGKPLSVVGKKKGNKEMEKTTGTHFMQNLFIDKRFKNISHYFYGTTVETLNQIKNNISHEYTDLKVCGYEPSIFRELTDDEGDELAERINKSKADFVWVAIGAPRQELLMNRLKGKVNAVMVGVGGAFNILAGKVNDAPMWMQNLGLEWLYRLYKEPRRLFKRYFITNSKFLYYVWRDR